jgi:hypothetical protein
MPQDSRRPAGITIVLGFLGGQFPNALSQVFRLSSPARNRWTVPIKVAGALSTLDLDCVDLRGALQRKRETESRDYNGTSTIRTSRQIRWLAKAV